MLFAGTFLLLLIIGGTVYLQQPVFGQSSNGTRLERIRKSPNYKDGAFQNLEYTPAFAEGYKVSKVMWEFFFRKSPDLKPTHEIPYVATDLKKLPPDSNLLVWFGHSSYYLQVNGVKMLVDPVFSAYASPVSFTTRAFAGANRYTVDDLPEIDYLFISHDHYDHLDHATVRALQSKVKKVVCGLGVGAILERWGYQPEQLIEADWEEAYPLEKGIVVHTLPARHFSGRGLKRNQTLWMSYLLETPAGKIYIGGDSGYGKHFARIGERFGPIDFAILENGQYNPAWHYIHCLPEETLQAARDLKAKNLMPVHNSKFPLALHAWDEPMKELTRLNGAASKPLHLVRPLLGEIVPLADSTREWNTWWEQKVAGKETLASPNL